LFSVKWSLSRWTIPEIGVFTDDFVGVGRSRSSAYCTASLAGGIIFPLDEIVCRFNHLISHNREGVLLNFYVAVIGVHFDVLAHGPSPEQVHFLMLGMVANGSATLEEVMRFFESENGRARCSEIGWRESGPKSRSKR